MRANKLTMSVIDALPMDETVWASDCAGLHARRGKRGVIFSVMYRNSLGVQRYVKLGSLQFMSPAQAYKAAKDIRLRAAGGQDPSAEKSEARAAGTLNDLIDAYLEAAKAGKVLVKGGAVKKANSLKSEGSRATHWLRPKLGKKPIGSIHLDTVNDFVTAVAAESSPANATACAALLSTMFAFGMKTRRVKKNPCVGVDKFTVQGKERVLSDDEWKALGVNLTKEGVWPHAAAMVRFLAHTAVRRSEAIALRFEFCDLKKRVVMFPETKTGKSVRYLSKQAVAIIESQRKAVAGDVVFPGVKAATIDPKWALDLVKPADDISCHTFRHSYATLAGLAYPEAVVGALLGHSRKGNVTKGYIHAGDPTALSPLLAAADFVSSRIDVLLSGADNVVQLHAAG